MVKKTRKFKNPPPLTISKAQAWLLAMRPRTLPAAIGPVLVGTAAAIADRCFVFGAALAAGVVAMLMQISVNLANDYFDHKHGIDTAERLGPLRVTQSGLLSPSIVKKGMVVIFGITVIAGLLLTLYAGWPVLAIGAACTLAAIAYSGGPWPLASKGLGDVFVFIFFGLVAVCGTYFLQAGNLHLKVVNLSIPVGLLITAILVVNNLRDIPTDYKTGKKTLAVRFGPTGARLEYLVLLAGAYFLPLLWFVRRRYSIWILLPLLTLPMAVVLAKKITQTEGAALNPLLGKTASLSLAYSFFLAIGIVIS